MNSHEAAVRRKQPLTVSQLIKQLQRIERVCGDLPVVLADEATDGPSRVEIIQSTGAFVVGAYYEIDDLLTRRKPRGKPAKRVLALVNTF